VRNIPGTFADIQGTVNMDQDYSTATNNQLYIGARFEATSGSSNAWHVFKIDTSQALSGSVP
jgi:hypothetical protein